MNALVRPARPSDKGPLMSFIKDVWGGHDYIPYVWDEWLKDEDAKLFVVEVDGTPVGMNRVSFLKDGAAWFQGVRVHPDYRGRGLATMLGRNSMKVAAEHGARVFRLTTNSWNFASRRQTEKMQFKEIARFGVYKPPARMGKPKDEVVKVDGSDPEGLFQLMTASKEFRLGSGLCWHDFATTSMTRQVLLDLAREGKAWRLGDAVAVVGKGGEGYETWEEVSFVGGPTHDAVRLVKSVLGRVKDADARWVFLPRKSPIIHALRKAGFVRDFSQIVYEGRAANG